MMRFDKACWIFALLACLLIAGPAKAQNQDELPRPKDVEELACLLKSRNVEERREAATTLAFMEQGSEKALLPLVAALKDVDPVVRRYAASAPGRIGPPAKPAVPALANLLGDKSVEVRRSSAGALVRLKSHAKAAAPVLLQSLQEEDPFVRIRSARVLISLGQESKRSLALLGEAFDDNDGDVGMEASLYFGDIGLPAIPVLKECLKDKRVSVRSFAAWALGHVASRCKSREEAFPPEATKCLIVLLKDEEKAVVAGALYALGRAGESAGEAVPAISECLKHPDWNMRLRAAGVLKEFGPSAIAAIPALKEALKDDKEQVRREAAETLEAIDPSFRRERKP
jgi:HEAT repeat protein